MSLVDDINKTASLHDYSDKQLLSALIDGKFGARIKQAIEASKNLAETSNG